MSLSNEELEEIIEKDLPGHRMSRKSFRNQDSEQAEEAVDSAFSDTDIAEAATPNIKTLREKYLREKYFGAEDSAKSRRSDSSARDSAGYEDASVAKESGDVIVATKPKDSSDLRDDSSQLKVAVISEAEKKVIGQQG
jgi:hypothetical protein